MSNVNQFYGTLESSKENANLLESTDSNKLSEKFQDLDIQPKLDLTGRKRKTARAFHSVTYPNSIESYSSLTQTRHFVDDASNLKDQCVAFSQPTKIENDGILSTLNLPSLPETRMVDQEFYRNNVFRTWAHRNNLPPRATTDFIAIDEGNSSPKFVKPSLSSIPLTSEILTQLQLPLAFYLQPLAQLRPEEREIPLVKLPAGSSPHRCLRCRTYINPFMQFVNGGAKIVCNICLFSSEVAESYFFPCDNAGKRLDFGERLELQNGTVDFVVPKEYNFNLKNESKPLYWIFAIDVSEDAITKGVTEAACNAIRDLIKNEDPEYKFDPSIRIQIMTFDRSIYYYDMISSAENISMLVASDIEDPFVPFSEEHFVDPKEYQENILTILERIESIFPDVRIPEPAIGAVLESAYCSLEKIGGKINIFLSSLATWGPGALKFREQNQSYANDSENNMFKPQNAYWNKMAEKFNEAGISVNQFVIPVRYVDLASIGTICSNTGGELYSYFNFIPSRDQEKLSKEFARTVARQQGYEAQLIMRCSNGLRISEYFGNFYQKRSQDIILSGVDADQSFVVELKYDGKLSNKLDAYFQCALLYTRSDGLRIVRLHNIALQISSSYEQIIDSANPDVLLSYYAHKSINIAIEKNLKLARHYMKNSLILTLTQYRKKSSTAANSHQLILPDRLRTLPVMVLGLLKTKALRGGTIASDVRVFHMKMIRRISLQDLSILIYPQLFSLHDLSDNVEFPDEQHLLVLPSQIQLNSSSLEDGGAYLLQNGLVAFFSVNKNTSTYLLQDMFGMHMDSIEKLDSRNNQFPNIDTRISLQSRNLIAYLNQKQPAKYLKIQLARKGIDGAELEYQFNMIEDKSPDAPGYRDFLYEIHKQIQNKLSK